jgi:hypothetical protein
MFWENSESFGEGRDVQWEICEALNCVISMGEGLEETLWDLWRHFLSPIPTFVIINEYKEEK